MSNGANNISMGANDQANVEITYQGTSKKSASPFGGIMVIEKNSTITTVTCTGDDLIKGTSPYHITYTASATTHDYRLFPYAGTIDDGTGSVKRITCQFLNGGTATDGSTYWIKFIPANYYVSNDGNFELDVEKFLNDDTTRTQIANTIQTNGGWAA